MLTTLRGAAELLRLREYLASVIFFTLVGVKIADGLWDLRLVLLLFANLGSIAFAFMINDVEDAAEDAQDPVKSRRNPVSAGRITPRLAAALSYLVAIGTWGLYALLGPLAWSFGTLALLMSWLYSSHQVRLKTRSPWDILAHALLFGGTQLAAAYATYSLDLVPLLPVLLLVLSVSMYGELWNELRDLESDLKVGLRHTAARLGRERTTWLMNGLLLLSGIGLLWAAYWVMIPWWLLGLCVLAGSIYALLNQLAHRQFLVLSDRFNLVIIYGAALGMLVWFLLD